MRAISIVEAVPELANNTILVNGVAKTYAMTGWRIGWFIGPADLVKGAANLQSHMTSNINNIAQIAAAAALDGPQEPIEEMRQAFDRRRGLIVEALNKVPGFHCPTPEGAFYAYVDVTAALGREIRGVTPTTSSSSSQTSSFPRLRSPRCPVKHSARQATCASATRWATTPSSRVFAASRPCSPNSARLATPESHNAVWPGRFRPGQTALWRG